MNCDELVERVTDYMEDALSAEDRARLDDHIRPCYMCRAYVGMVNATLRVVSSLPAERLPDELESTLLARFQDWRQSA
jgi:anti-sigma factor RsiW